MSLVCHTIVSRYTPQQRDPISQVIEGSDDIWQTESSVGATRRLHSRPVPSFIPASFEYDEYGMPNVTTTVEPQHTEVHERPRDVSVWYHNLTAQGRVNPERRSRTAPPCPSPVAPTSPSSLRSSPDMQIAQLNNDTTPKGHNWFASRPAQANATHSPKPSTLVDLLTRNPPPLPSEPAFKPPVFLTIGPSNKGFTMLQRRGWQEGEGLGSARVERDSTGGLGANKALQAAFQAGSKPDQRKLARESSELVTLPNGAKMEVIDLTLSDHEADSAPDAIDLTVSDEEEEEEEAVDSTQTEIQPPTSHGTTLLTPIPTTLKVDRLGIGLKSSRYPKSVKRKAVTHTPAAIAAHIRAANKAHKDRMRYGRGSRGFARIKRKEAEERANLLAYLNS